MAALVGRTGLARVATRVGRGARFPVVLAYHSIAPSSAPPPYVSPAISIPRELFRRQLRRLARRYPIVALAEVERLLAAGESPPPGAVAITFDDGYADNVELGLPELSAVGASATIFVTTAPMMRRRPLWTAELALLLERTRVRRLELSDGTWNLHAPESRWQLRRALTRAWAVLAPDEVGRRLLDLADRLDLPPGQADDVILDVSAARDWAAAGMGLGGHTVHHPNLAYQTREVIRSELAGSVEDLSGVLGDPPRLMAYPNCGGLPRHFTQEVAGSVRDAGFRLACTSISGPVTPATRATELPRLGVTRRLWNVDRLEIEIARTRFRGARA